MMKKTLLLTLSLAALMAAAPALQAQDAAAPAVQDATAETAPQQASGGESNPAADPAPEGTPAEPAPISVSEDETQSGSPAAEPEAVEEGEHAAAAAEDAGSHHTPEPRQVDWSFNGPFGTFDRAALQRGLQVYKNVCAACHGLTRVAYRNLSALGYSEAEIKALAAEATVMDGPNDEGEMFERPGRPADHFKAPFANDNAARYANNGALPPDLSLITRARHDGSNYVYSILTGYEAAPADVAVAPGMHYNKFFPGQQIAMAQPLVEGAVPYADGTEATIDQMAKDVATFLTWAAEPAMEERKQTGVKVMIFLLVFSVLMYLTKRRIWKDLH